MDVDDDRPPSPPDVPIVPEFTTSEGVLDILFDLEGDEPPSPAIQKDTTSPESLLPLTSLARGSQDLLTFAIDVEEPQLTFTPRCLVFPPENSLTLRNSNGNLSAYTSDQSVRQFDRKLGTHRRPLEPLPPFPAIHDGCLHERSGTDKTSVIEQDADLRTPISQPLNILHNQAIRSPALTGISRAEHLLTDASLSYELDLDDHRPPSPINWGSSALPLPSEHEEDSMRLASLSFDFNLDDDTPYSPPNLWDIPAQVKDLERPADHPIPLRSPIHLTSLTKGTCEFVFYARSQLHLLTSVIGDRRSTMIAEVTGGRDEGNNGHALILGALTADSRRAPGNSNILADLFLHQHWAARFKRFPMNSVACTMTCYESDYLLAECNQDMNVVEMSVSWLTKELQGDKRHWEVSPHHVVSMYL